MRYVKWLVLCWFMAGLAAQASWADNEKPFEEYKEKYKDKYKDKKDKHYKEKYYKHKKAYPVDPSHHNKHDVHLDRQGVHVDPHPPALIRVPPGLAKKGGLPPGLAKKFGRHVPDRAYIAFDPNRYDQAWFLIDDRWVLKPLTRTQRVEIREYVDFPSVAPPVPLPSVNLINLRVVLFD